MKRLYIEHHIGSSNIMDALRKNGVLEDETEVIFRHNVHGSTAEFERLALAISDNPFLTSLHFDSPYFDHVAELFHVLTETRCLHIKNIEFHGIRCCSDLVQDTDGTCFVSSGENTDAALQFSLQRYFLVNRHIDTVTIRSSVPTSLDFLTGLVELGTLNIDGSACPASSSSSSMLIPTTTTMTPCCALECLNIVGVTDAHTENISTLLAQFSSGGSSTMTRLRVSIRNQLVKTEQATQVWQPISQIRGLTELEIGSPSSGAAATRWLCEMVNEAVMASESIVTLSFFEYSWTTMNNDNRRQAVRPLLQCCRSKLTEFTLRSSSCCSGIDESEVLDNDDDRFLSDLLLENQVLEKVDLTRFSSNNKTSTPPEKILDLLPSMANIKSFAFPKKRSSVSFLNHDQLRKLLNVAQACPTLTTLDYSAAVHNDDDDDDKESADATTNMARKLVLLKQAITDCLEINMIRQSSFLRDATPQLYSHAIASPRPRRLNTVYFLLREKNEEIILPAVTSRRHRPAGGKY